LRVWFSTLKRGAVLIVAVSYDSSSLNKRMDTLQRVGHIVIPASSLAPARKAIQSSNYHLLLIGATVPKPDRQSMAELSRSLRPISKIISVEFPNARSLVQADRHVMAGDENSILMAVASLLSGDAESDLEERRR
jgi:hypothetical protein